MDRMRYAIVIHSLYQTTKKFYKCGLNKTKFILYAYMLSNPKMYTESVKSGWINMYLL